MIFFTIIVAIAIASGAIALYTICAYAELKGYQKGLEYAERILTGGDE